MKNFGILALAASAKLAFAHTTIYAAWINGVDQGLGNTAAGYIRSPPNNNPVKDVTSADLTCNVNNVATAKTLTVASGDEFTFEWHHDGRTDSDDIIASSHKGPVIVYMAPTDGLTTDGWVKIYEDGYDATTSTWAVDTLITNKGKHSITIPNVSAGDYLLRAEIIALHEASTVGAAQFYMECVQVKIATASSGAVDLPTGVSFPGAYSATDAGIQFNIYTTFDSYPIPGPALWDGSSSGSSATTAATSAVVASTAAASSSAVSTQAAVVATTSAKATSAAVVASSSTVKASTSAVVVASSAKVVSSSAVVVATSAAAVTTKSTAAPTTLATVVKTLTTSTRTSAAASATTGASGTVAMYGQCGGSNWTGATKCVAGTTCKVQNPYYSQCVSA